MAETVGTQLILHGIDDAACKLMLTDTTISTTYDSLLKIPSIQEISFKPDIFTDKLKAKGVIRDVFSILESCSFTFQHAEINLNVLAALTGSGTVVAAGSSPNQTQTMTLTNTSVAPYFKLEGQVKYVETLDGVCEDCHFICFKAKLTGYSFALNQEGYMTLSGEGIAIPTVADGNVLSIVANQTETAIA